MPINVQFEFGPRTAQGRRSVEAYFVRDADRVPIHDTGRPIDVASEAGRGRFLADVLAALGRDLEGHGQDLETLGRDFQAWLGNREEDEHGAAALVAAADVTGRRLAGHLPDLPAEPEDIGAWELPRGWMVDRESGVMTHSSGGSFPCPVVLTGRLQDLDGGSSAVRVAWRRDGAWHSRDVAATTAFDRRKIVELRGYDLPVSSTNAGVLVQLLESFEAANLERLRPEQTTGRMGWLEDFSGFLCGRTMIGRPGRRVQFQGYEGGDDQVADGFAASADADGWECHWRETVGLLRDLPGALAVLTASLSSPLLEMLDVPGFVVDICGETSTGKTTLLRAAASIWGRPDEMSDAAALTTWKATTVGYERRSAVLRHLPYLIDDSKLARSPEARASFIYATVSGRPPTRGTPGRGLAQMGSWRHIAISTGEAPLSSYTADGGASARTLELWGPTLGPRDRAIPLVRTLNQRVRLSYGHAGPAFVGWLIEHREEVAAWRERLRVLVDEELAAAGNDPVAGRVAAYVAVLRLGFELAREAGVMPADLEDPLPALRAQIYEAKADQDRATEALRVLWDHYLAHEADFMGLGVEADGHVKGREVAGYRRDAGGRIDIVGFTPTAVKKILEARGIREGEALIRQWHDRDWLRVTPNRGHQYQVRLPDGVRTSVIAIKGEALEAVLGVGAQWAGRPSGLLRPTTLAAQGQPALN